MPGPSDTTKVVDGVVGPSLADVKLVVARLQKEVAADPKMAASFKRNPRSVLGAMGLNGDVQNELLRDFGLSSSSKAAPALRCWVTCWFTRCAITRIVIKK